MFLLAVVVPKLMFASLRPIHKLVAFMCKIRRRIGRQSIGSQSWIVLVSAKASETVPNARHRTGDGRRRCLNARPAVAVDAVAVGRVDAHRAAVGAVAPRRVRRVRLAGVDRRRPADAGAHRPRHRIEDELGRADVPVRVQRTADAVAVGGFRGRRRRRRQRRQRRQRPTLVVALAAGTRRRDELELVGRRLVAAAGSVEHRLQVAARARFHFDEVDVLLLALLGRRRRRRFGAAQQRRLLSAVGVLGRAFGRAFGLARGGGVVALETPPVGPFGFRGRKEIRAWRSHPKKKHISFLFLTFRFKWFRIDCFKDRLWQNQIQPTTQPFLSIIAQVEYVFPVREPKSGPERTILESYFLSMNFISE